ncbi:MAG TPA: TetR/AcrR family transcriptional regulator [Myxococcota bacterium]
MHARSERPASVDKPLPLPKKAPLKAAPSSTKEKETSDKVPRDTREQILRVSGHLLQTRGFSGFSYANVAEVLGVKPAAIHYHFPQKHDLGLALIERYRARYRRWMEEAADQGLTPTATLEGYIRISSRFGEDGRVCPVGILTAELAGLPDELHAPVEDMVEELLSWLGGIVREGRKTKEFVYPGTPEDAASLIAAALQGALQLSRGTRRPCFDAVVRGVRLSLGLPAVAE